MKICRLYVLADLFSLSRVITAEIVEPNEDRPCGCPHSCAEAELLGLVREDRPTWIFNEDSKRKVLASCRVSDGGGWTVIQRRVDGRVSFNHGWEQYSSGFGWRGPKDEMWFGNKHIRAVLRAHGRSVLQIRLEADDGGTAGAEYTNFRLDDKEHMYRMYVDFTPQLYNTADSLLASNGSRFSTRDRDVDPDSCAVANGGGWWWPEHNSYHCTTSNLNGFYHGVGTFTNFWSGFRGLRGLNYSEMRVRPLIFNRSREEYRENPCSHGGRCEFDGKTSSYKCLCTPDYWGDDCRWNAWLEPANMAALIVGIAVPVVVLCFLVRYLHPSIKRRVSLDLEAHKAALAKGGEDVAISETEGKHHEPTTKHDRHHMKHNKPKKPKKRKSNATM